VLDAGEECDDGNLLAGDGCDASCRSELVPGGGPRHTDCIHEWLTSPVPRRGPDGVPVARVTCVDDDPACDFGVAAGDGACTFHVALCLDVRERRFVDRDDRPLCTATDVAWLSLISPREAGPHDAADVHTRDALETAIAAVGGIVRRQCELPGAATSTPCASDADCGHARRCRGRFMAFAPPFDARGACTPFADVVVPLRHAGRAVRAGTRLLRVTAATSDAATGRDADTLKLVCLPAAPP